MKMQRHIVRRLEEQPHFTSWQVSTLTVKSAVDKFTSSPHTQPIQQTHYRNQPLTPPLLPLGLPLVRHPPRPPIPPPHPPTPRHTRPNLEHRILQRTPLSLPTHSLGESPAIPHSQLRRLPAALPPRTMAQSLRGPGQSLAAECDCRGGLSAVFDAVGAECGGLDGVVDQGESVGEV